MDLTNTLPTTAPADEDALTAVAVRRMVPQSLRSSITDEYIDKLNNINTDPVLRDHIRQNFISYTSVLSDGKYKVADYLSAVMFVSFKLMGDSDRDAYAKTFPQRYAALAAKGAASKEISSYVSIYRKGKLVTAIMQQSMVPAWVLNQDMYQAALNTQFSLMNSSPSDKVRTEAANSLLTHLKVPEAAKNTINIGMSSDALSGLNALSNALDKLVNQQQSSIASGTHRTIDITAANLPLEEEE